jgi:hypothetical protein
MLLYTQRHNVHLSLPHLVSSGEISTTGSSAQNTFLYILYLQWGYTTSILLKFFITGSLVFYRQWSRLFIYLFIYLRVVNLMKHLASQKIVEVKERHFPLSYSGPTVSFTIRSQMVQWLRMSWDILPCSIYFHGVWRGNFTSANHCCEIWDWNRVGKNNCVLV